MKRKKNRASDPPPPGAVDVEDDDPRLARRLRRRSVALQSSKLHSQRNYGLSNCNMALAKVAGVDYIVIDDDDDDGDENHAHLDFSQSLGECDQTPTKIPSVRCDQTDVDAEEGKFEDVGPRANVGEIHEVASTSPISKFSHIDDENRGERTHNNRAISEELDIDHGLFCSALDSKQLAKVLEPISSELNDHVSNRSSARVLGSVNSNIEYEENMDVVDETYRNFLNCVRQEGSYVVFAPKNGKEVVLEKYEESSVDSEVIVLDGDPFSDDAHSPFVTYVESDEGIEISSGKCCLRFRDGVMEILEKPFDEKEYQDLLNEATIKRKVVRDKELRSGPKQFQLPGPGKSYLDQHRDLAAIIDSSENNKPKVLNLLRGFFYWLQKVAHNGVFKPWLDFSCLEVLPQ